MTGNTTPQQLLDLSLRLASLFGGTTTGVMQRDGNTWSLLLTADGEPPMTPEQCRGFIDTITREKEEA